MSQLLLLPSLLKFAWRTLCGLVLLGLPASAAPQHRPAPDDPGLPLSAKTVVNALQPGSVLVFNLYSSDAARPQSENTRLTLTNVHPTRAVFVHLFFIGNNCHVADTVICLGSEQTLGMLAADFDPGMRGYAVVVAIDQFGCPIHFNELLGEASVKLASGHAASLPAESFASLALNPVSCLPGTTAVELLFDGVHYSLAPRVLAADNFPSQRDGNLTMVVLNRLGGDLRLGASTTGTIFGILYDDGENPYGYSFGGACQVQFVLACPWIRCDPRITVIIPSGRTGWLKLYNGTTDIALLGAILNSNGDPQARPSNFGHNLHVLALAKTARLVLPVYPVRC